MKTYRFAALIITTTMIVCTACKKDPPIEPQFAVTAQVVSVESSSAVIKGTVPSSVSSVTVCWDTLQNPTTDKGHIAVTPHNGEFTVTLTGLTPEKQYYARAYAYGNYSPAVNFTTKEPSTYAGTLAATDLGLHTATLNGYVVLNGDPMTYWFEYGPTQAYETKTSVQTTVPGSGTVGLSAQISGLDWHQAYYFRLVLRKDGESLPCSGLSFNTLGDVPTIEGISIDNGSLDKIILRAKINPNSLATTVSFSWGKTSSYGQSAVIPPPLQGDAGNEVSLEINVERATEYHFQVKAENAIGTTISNDTTACSLALIDRQGKKFWCCKIGNQYWLTANWQVLTYNNGDVIPNITDPVAWGQQTKGALCYYDNSQANYDIYGPLYNWWVISDPRGICPPGWHVPSWDEWYSMYLFLGGLYSDGGGRLKEAGFTHWFPKNVGATNSTGFTALPAGGRGPEINNPAQSEFDELHTATYFWTSGSCPDPASAWVVFLTGRSSGIALAQGGPKYQGATIRLIKD